MYRLIEKLHLERYLNTRLILAIDLAVSGLASLCALVSVKLLLHLNISDYTLLWLCCSVVYSIVTFYLLKTYHSVIRHSTLRELSKFVVATFSKEILLGLTVVLYPPAPQFSLHILALLLLDLLLTLCGLILIRVAMIIIYDLVKDNLKYRKQRQQVLVYGLSEKSVSLVTRLQRSPHYKIVGFLTFGRNMKNHTIAECPVYYFENEYSIRYLRQRYDIDAVLFPTNEEAQAEQERLIRYCVESNLKILIAPPIDEVIDGKIMRQSIREIKIEDLLGRPEIKISLDEIIANFREKTVMVTGAAGSIGSELCRQLASFGIEKLILFDNAEAPMHNLRLELEERFPKLEFVPVIGDIRLPNRLDFAFRTFHPQVVFHAAAYKHVPLMEENPCEAVLVNVIGTRNVALKCLEYNVEKMVMISTDSTIHLYIDPVLWNQSNQITSDVMDIFTERQLIKRAEFIGSPMMASQLDTTHYNQVAGKTMPANFYNNQIYRNDVNGNAQTIYYMQDGEPPEITMMGVIESGDCSFYIEDKQVVQITYRTEPVYNFYPMDDIPPTQDLYLKGFKWEGARRPVQADVFDRRIRPSQRKERTRLRHPDFPILMRIEEHKRRLIEQRRWADRNDQVDPLTVEWMRELGYEVGQPREPQRPAPQAE